MSCAVLVLVQVVCQGEGGGVSCGHMLFMLLCTKFFPIYKQENMKLKSRNFSI